MEKGGEDSDPPEPGQCSLFLNKVPSPQNMCCAGALDDLPFILPFQPM